LSAIRQKAAMNTRPTAILLSVIHLSFASVAWAADPACKIELDQQPELSTLTAAGLRFLNPEHIVFVWDKYSSGKFTLSSEATAIDLKFGGANAHLGKSEVGVEIFSEDLLPPGKYYPPQPPAGDHSKVGGVFIHISDRSSEDAQELASELAKVFKLDEPKVTAWFSSLMWEVSPSFELGSPISVSPDKSSIPSVRLSIYKVGERGKAEGPLSFSLSLSLSWPNPKTNNRVLPPNPPSIQPAGNPSR
jgi:hypothetical protein